MITIPLGVSWKRGSAQEDGREASDVTASRVGKWFGSEINWEGWCDFPADSTTAYYIDDSRTLGESLGLLRRNYAEFTPFPFMLGY